MATQRTETQTTHYEIQKKRRANTLEEWRQNQRFVIKGSDVTFEETPRRMRRGVMLSADADKPTVVLDSVQHEVPAGNTSTIHRHSWDAMMFVISGSGWTEIEGQRVSWRPWDTVYLPAWKWHRHGNPHNADARFITWSTQPQAEMLGYAMIEEAGDESVESLPKRPTQQMAPDATDTYSRRLQRLAARAREEDDTRLITTFDEIPFRITPRGARSGFLVDPSIGYRTSGLTAVMHQLAPGLYQSRHRHGGEAWLYVVEGSGHSEMDGEEHPWEQGDLVVVDHWAWHQHFNSNPDRIASLIRIHNFDSLYMAMRIMLDPLDLFEELPKLDAPDISNVQWPEPGANRPTG